MGELNALRRAGRARRVDQRQQVVRPDLRDGLGGIEVRVHLHQLVEGVVAALAVDDDHVLEIRQLLARLVERVEVRLSMIATLLPASESRYWICSGSEVW